MSQEDNKIEQTNEKSQDNDMDSLISDGKDDESEKQNEIFQDDDTIEILNNQEQIEQKQKCIFHPCKHIGTMVLRNVIKKC